MSLSPVGRTVDPRDTVDVGTIFNRGVPPLRITKPVIFAEKIAEIMKENTPESYRYVLCGPDGVISSGAGGFSRQAVDPPEMVAKVDDRQNICSMSKMITAAAVLASLQDKGLSPEIPVAPFLPADWILHDEVKTITFQQFMSHHSGFYWDAAKGAPKQDSTGFDEMKAILAQKPFFAVGSTDSYRNINAAIFRVVLPHLDAYNRFTKKITLPIVGPIDQFVANRYVEIVNRLVLQPSGVALAGCNSSTLALPSGANGRPPPVGSELPVLAYHYKKPTQKGIDVGNRTIAAGADGWCLSVNDIARVLQTILYTEVVLSEKSRSYMALPQPGTGCGMNAELTKAGDLIYSHGAVIPFEQGIEGAMLSGWYLCYAKQKLIVVVLSNSGHDANVVGAKGNWDMRVKAAYEDVYG